MAHPMIEKQLGRHRALRIVRGEIEAYAFEEVVAAWQAVHDYGMHDQLLDWQKGVLQNMVFGQVVLGEPRVIPGIPKFHPYGALKGIEK